MPIRDPASLPATAQAATLHLSALAQRGTEPPAMVAEVAALVSGWLDDGAAEAFRDRLDELADNVDAAVAGLAERLASGNHRDAERQARLQAQLDALLAAMRALGQVRARVHATTA